MMINDIRIIHLNHSPFQVDILRVRTRFRAKVFPYVQRKSSPNSTLFWYECGKVRTRKTSNMDTIYAETDAQLSADYLIVQNAICFILLVYFKRVPKNCHFIFKNNRLCRKMTELIVFSMRSLYHKYQIN